MSNFVKMTKHPKTGEFEPAYWMDDYFGPHHYGVKFLDGTIVNLEEKDVETSDEPCPKGIMYKFFGDNSD